MKTYFLYDGNHVIMEADEDGITAKNTYGGPLLLRTVFHEEGSEETYQYLYNAHGDVVTLLADGEVAATYCYDSFGNIESQTGDVDNAILYAGYQYDEETGLYYINARMYDPVTAQFLQRDTYAGINFFIFRTFLCICNGSALSTFIKLVRRGRIMCFDALKLYAVWWFEV